MKKYRKKPIVIEAEQWFKLGDVPEANIEPILNNVEFICGSCGKTAQEHGIIQTLEGSHIVCPGDYIIKGIKGEFYPCKPDIFKETYEEVSNKSGRDEALELFSEARGFTKEEAEAYNQSLSELFVQEASEIIAEEIAPKIEMSSKM